MLIDDNIEYFMMLIYYLIEKVNILGGIWCKDVFKRIIWFLNNIICKYIIWFE